MTFKFITQSFGRVARLTCGGLLALTIASCGGGGGSAGTNPNSGSGSGTGTGTGTGTTVTAAGLNLIANPISINSTSVSPVSITVTAVDKNNVGLANVPIQFSTDTGIIVPTATPVVTDLTGTVTATLGLNGNTTPRTINISATGGGQTAKATVTVVGTTTQTPNIALLFSSPTMPSATSAASAVTVTAQVENGNNDALAGVPITFSASSGIISGSPSTSGNGGLATVTVNNGGDPTNRVITITATGNGVTKTANISVTGTTMTATKAPTALTLGTLTQYQFTLQDSSGKAIANAPVTFTSAVGNTVVADPLDAGTAAAPLTDNNGNITLDITPTVGGQDTLTVKAKGATAATSFNTTTQSLAVNISDISTPASPVVVSVTPQPLSEYTSTSCLAVNAFYVNGTANASGPATVATSRGQLFTTSNCAAASLYNSNTTNVTFNNAGQMTPTLYLSTTTPGSAIVTVSEMPGGLTQTASVGFITQLTAANVPNVSLTASPADVFANTNAANPNAQFSVITATVRDGSALNNLVQGVPVQFTLSPDPSNGKISPPVAYTQANGQAQAIFYPGPATTLQNGVVVKAQLQGAVTLPAPVAVDLTVSGSSLFVTLGTGNLIGTSGTTSYLQDWAVYVTDSNGNPVQNAVVVAQFTAISYTKGTLIYSSPTYPQIQPAQWIINPNSLPTDGFNLAQTASGPFCPNTDPTDTGVYVPGGPYPIVYPFPSPLDPVSVTKANTPYPFVMPGIPGNVQYTNATLNSQGQAVTDAKGFAIVSIVYPKDHAIWTNAKLTVTASNVLGTQATSSAVLESLPVLAADFTALSPAPPGTTSPYGTNQCGVAF
ncbi:MAG TPA: hypothetical protein VNW52_11995 [Burkholderiaceae bacterium]|jgi:hypothetical protein|nr:hypothetical protein [Burkholderiaceae bacterium]